MRSEQAPKQRGAAGPARGQLLNLEAIDWPTALVRLGVPEQLLGKRQGPCPNCKGKTRFRFTNRFGKGNWYCNHCGSGDGVTLASVVTGRTPQEILRELRGMTGVAVSPHKIKADSERRTKYIRSLMAKLWDEALPLTRADPVVRYLRKRMPEITPAILRAASAHLRYHPALDLPEEMRKEAQDRNLPTRMPAMLARVASADNVAVGLHRTYLTPEGDKAPFENVKFCLGVVNTGSAVRFGPAGPVVGVCEGIETALAVMIQAAGAFPMWAALSADGMESVILPAECRAVLTFGDNDRNGRGFVAQDKLGRRLKGEGRHVQPHFPDRVGWDFLDQLRESPVRIDTVEPSAGESVH